MLSIWNCESAVEAIVASLRLDELAGLELVFQPIDVVEHARDELAGGVLQRQRDVLAAAARSHRLVSAEEESPARGLADRLRDRRKAHERRINADSCDRGSDADYAGSASRLARTGDAFVAGCLTSADADEDDGHRRPRCGRRTARRGTARRGSRRSAD